MKTGVYNILLLVLTRIGAVTQSSWVIHILIWTHFNLYNNNVLIWDSEIKDFTKTSKLWNIMEGIAVFYILFLYFTSIKWLESELGQWLQEVLHYAFMLTVSWNPVTAHKKCNYLNRPVAFENSLENFSRWIA